MVCIDCGEEKERKGNFYKHTRRRWKKRCKVCELKRLKEIRDHKRPLNRVCQGCGQEKSDSEFRTPHGNCHCFECSSEIKKNSLDN